MSSKRYVVIWPGGHTRVLTVNSFSSARKTHQAKRDDDPLYTETKHTQQEYLAALDAAVLMDKVAALEAAGMKG